MTTSELRELKDIKVRYERLKRDLDKKQNAASRLLIQRNIAKFQLHELNEAIKEAYAESGGVITVDNPNTKEMLFELLSIFKNQCAEYDQIKEKYHTLQLLIEKQKRFSNKEGLLESIF